MNETQPSPHPTLTTPSRLPVAGRRSRKRDLCDRLRSRQPAPGSPQEQQRLSDRFYETAVRRRTCAPRCFQRMRRPLVKQHNETTERRSVIYD